MRLTLSSLSRTCSDRQNIYQEGISSITMIIYTLSKAAVYDYGTSILKIRYDTAHVHPPSSSPERIDSPQKEST